MQKTYYCDQFVDVMIIIDNQAPIGRVVNELVNVRRNDPEIADWIVLGIWKEKLEKIWAKKPPNSPALQHVDNHDTFRSEWLPAALHDVALHLYLNRF